MLLVSYTSLSENTLKYNMLLSLEKVSKVIFPSIGNGASAYRHSYSEVIWPADTNISRSTLTKPAMSSHTP